MPELGIRVGKNLSERLFLQGTGSECQPASQECQKPNPKKGILLEGREKRHKERAGPLWKTV